MDDQTENQIQTLKRIRSKLGLNRTDFACEMGIPLRTVEEWESGRRRMPDYVLRFLTYYALGRKILFKDRDIEYEKMKNEL